VINLFEEDLPERDILTGKPTGFLKAAGMGFMKGGVNVAKAATILAYGHGGNTEGSRDMIYNFYEDYIKPAEKYWSIDPNTTSQAGQIFHGIAQIGIPLMFGPAAAPVMIGESVINTGADLIDQGVDERTSRKGAMLAGLSMYGMVKIPAASKSIARTLGLVTANPLLGAGQTALTRELLESEGYEKQAEQYDPFDPIGRSVDFAMGLAFGAMHHAGIRRSKKAFEKGKAEAVANLDSVINNAEYNDYLKTLPIEAEDALNIIRQHQQKIRETPFDSKAPAQIRQHLDAMDKALADLSKDMPVNITSEVRDIMKEIPAKFTRPELIRGLKEQFGLGDDETNAVMGLIEARAKMLGETVDEHLGKRVAGVVPGMEQEGLMYQLSPEGEAPKAAVQFLKDGRAVIHAFQKADLSSAIHEFAHIWQRDLTGPDLDITNNWLGVKDGMEWQTRHHEQFAKAFERYIGEGKAPSKELQPVFEKLKTWIVDIYRRLRSGELWNVKMSPEIRQVFDRMFAEVEGPAAIEKLEVRKIISDEVLRAEDEIDEVARMNDMEPQIVDMEQGTPEWLELRMGKRMASESAAVLGLSPWTKPRDLWELKTGRKQFEINKRMAMGSQMEGPAREAVNKTYGVEFKPSVMMKGEFGASLDGLSPDGKTILEVKVPYEGKNSKTWKEAAEGKIAEHYRAQVQHQLMISGAQEAWFVVHDRKTGEQLRLIEKADAGIQKKIVDAWEKFWPNVEADKWPEERTLKVPPMEIPDQFDYTGKPLKKDSDVGARLATPGIAEPTTKKGAASGAPTGKKSGDTILKWIDNKGGINYKVEKLKGEIDAVIEDNPKVGKILRKKGAGQTLDQLALMAKDEGWIKEATPDALLEAVRENRLHPESAEGRDFATEYEAYQERKRMLEDDTSEIVVEDFLADAGDLPGTLDYMDKDGNTITGTAKDILDRTRADLEAMEQHKGTFDRIGLCVRQGG